jgi:nicotinamidase-related amidase
MKGVLVVVDYQNDFISPSGQVAKRLGNNILKKNQALAPKIQNLINEWHKRKKPVVFVVSDYGIKHYKGWFRKIRTEMKNAYGGAAVKGTRGHELYELKSGKSDYFVVKHYFDGFYKTKLEDLLKKIKAGDIYICGANTDVCVFHTAIGSSFRGYRTFVIKDATETISPNKGLFLDYLDKYAGVRIISSNKII